MDLGLSNFNSTMVRLIAKGNKIIHLEFKEFQFHDGTIDSSASDDNLAVSFSFQFHDGTIDRIELLISCSLLSISIPRWYD